MVIEIPFLQQPTKTRRTRARELKSGTREASSPKAGSLKRPSVLASTWTPSRRMTVLRNAQALLEKQSRQPGLSNDARQSACSHGVVKRNGNRNGRALGSLLHDAMTPALADRKEPMIFENPADIRA